MFYCWIAGCIICGIVTLITFFLYVRARMSDRPGHEVLEKRYLSLHYLSLFLFVLFGVLILIRLSDSINSGASYS